MKKKIIIQFSLLLVLFGLFLFTGCDSLFTIEEDQPLLNGQAMLTINIGTEDGRTLFPEYPIQSLISKFELSFTPKEDQTPVSTKTLTNTETSKTFSLEPGLWDITLKAYRNFSYNDSNYNLSGEHVIIQKTASSYSVSASGVNNLSFKLLEGVNNIQGRTGRLAYDISYPVPLDNAGTISILDFDSLELINSASISSISGSVSGSFSLAPGYYYLVVNMTRNDLELTKVEVIHISSSMFTRAEGTDYIFVSDDFITGEVAPAQAPAITDIIPGGDQLTIEWTEVSGATSYNVQYRTGLGGWSYIEDNPVTETSATITGLSSNTLYYIRVSARNNGGSGPWSSEASESTLAGALTAPGQPAAVAGNAVITVSWDTVQNADAYEVWYRVVNEDETFGTPLQFGSSTVNTSINITGLTNGTTYQVRVRAVNSGGAGDWSPWTGNRTPDVSVLPSPSTLYSSSITNTGFTVTWSAVSQAASYAVYISTENNHSTATFYGNASALNINITGRNPGTIYFVWVRARDDSSVLGSYSSSLKVATTLPAPGISGVTGGKESVTVSWSYSTDIYSDPYYNSSLTVLQNNVWFDANHTTVITREYQFYVYNGVQYAVQWDDSYQGTSTKTADIGVAAYYKGATNTTIFNRTDSGYNTPQTFTANRTGIVVLLVTTYDGAGGVAGTYGLRYYINSGTEPVVYDSDVDAFDVFVSTSSSAPSSSTIPTATVAGNFNYTVIADLIPNGTYYAWVRAKKDNNGEWVLSNWSSYLSGRVLNNQTTLSSFRLYYNSNNNYGTVSGNNINFTVPYGVNISSIQTYFSLPTGATANITSSSYYSYTSPRTIIVTAEDGTTASYTITVTGVNTPINITFSAPVDEVITVTNAPTTVTQSSTLNLSAPTGYAGYRWIVNNENKGSTSSYSQAASTLPLGPNSITLVIYKNEGGVTVPYSKTISFTVTP